MNALFLCLYFFFFFASSQGEHVFAPLYLRFLFREFFIRDKGFSFIYIYISTVKKFLFFYFYALLLLYFYYSIYIIFRSIFFFTYVNLQNFIQNFFLHILSTLQSVFIFTGFISTNRIYCVCIVVAFL